MNKILSFLLDWSEVWAPLIPLFILFLYRNQPKILKPVTIYIGLAWVLNLMIDFIWVFKKYLPPWLQSNNPIYNIQSLVRFICFSLFFSGLPQNFFKPLRLILPFIFFSFFILNFGLWENFFNPLHLSGNLLSAESYLLLIYCMLYYLAELRDDHEELINGPKFWVVTGLSLYVVVSFFVFLFYVPMNSLNGDLSDAMWNFHNIAFIIFCLFLAIAFYEPFRNKYSV